MAKFEEERSLDTCSLEGEMILVRLLIDERDGSGEVSRGEIIDPNSPKQGAPLLKKEGK